MNTNLNSKKLKIPNNLNAILFQQTPKPQISSTSPRCRNVAEKCDGNRCSSNSVGTSTRVGDIGKTYVNGELHTQATSRAGGNEHHWVPGLLRKTTSPQCSVLKTIRYRVLSNQFHVNRDHSSDSGSRVNCSLRLNFSQVRCPHYGMGLSASRQSGSPT